MAAFEIDGREYAVPSVFEMTMGEAQTLYDYTGYVLEDFVPAHPSLTQQQRDEYEHGRVEKMRNPAFKRAMIHIAYQRGNPQVADADVRSLVNSMDALEMTASMYGGDDENPTTSSQNEPEKSNGTNEHSSSTGSGSRSTTGSGLPDGIRAPIGTTGSDTSSRQSGLVT